MRTTFLMLGWLLAVALGIVAVMEAGRAREERGEAARAEERLAAAQASVDELSTRVDDISGQMDDLLIELNDLETAKAELEAVNRVAVETAVDVEEAAPEPVAETGPSDDNAKRKNPFAKMFGGVMTDEMAEQSAKMSAEMQYGDLIGELALDDARSNQVREIITRVLTEQTKSALDDTNAAQSNDGDRLRDELAQVLSAEELAEFDQYQAVLPEKMLRQQYAVQLGTYAAQLSEEDRTMMLDVLVEESLGMQTDAFESREDPAAVFQRQLAVFDNTAVRLADVFNEEQMVPIDRFLDQQRAAVEMVMRMMESDEEEDAQAPK